MSEDKTKAENQKVKTFTFPIIDDLIPSRDLYRGIYNVGARFNRKRFGPIQCDKNLLFAEAEEVERRFRVLESMTKHGITFVKRHEDCEAPASYFVS
jgi:hypothetical protein